jgi:hypothetical protein
MDITFGFKFAKSMSALYSDIAQSSQIIEPFTEAEIFSYFSNSPSQTGRIFLAQEGSLGCLVP